MRKLNIALVAHDARKQELVDWVRFNGKTLYPHNLIATGTTGKLLSEILVNDLEETFPGQKIVYYSDHLYVTSVLSGPLGGDQMIGAMIAQGHQTDISALTRLASLYNIAFATNRTTADMILTSSLFGNEDYVPIKQDFSSYLNRKL